MLKGIDVSYHNGLVDFETVKQAGFDFVFCRSSYGLHADETFSVNVENAHKAGLLVGAYHYDYGLTPTDSEKQAIFCRDYIDNTGVMLELPVFYDMEDADNWKYYRNFDFSVNNITEMCKTFINNLGLKSGVYASYYYLTNLINWPDLNCPVWCAQWGDTDDFKGYCWQYTDKEIIDGKHFDANIIYGEV